MHSPPPPGVDTVQNRLVAESSLVCLVCCEQPSLVDCEPSSNSVHGRDSEARRGRLGKGFLFRGRKLGSGAEKSPNLTEPGASSVLCPWECRRSSAFSTSTRGP